MVDSRLRSAFCVTSAIESRISPMDSIVERSGVTKGALYHHFGSKKGLAQALIEGPIKSMVVDEFLRPLGVAENPIDGIQNCINTQLSQMTDEHMVAGCPLNNLAQELSSMDDDFQNQIEGVYDVWRESLSTELAAGQESGTFRVDVNADEVATFVVAACAGTAGFAKTSRSIEVGRASMRVLCDYLETLRPAGSRRPWTGSARSCSRTCGRSSRPPAVGWTTS